MRLVREHPQASVASAAAWFWNGYYAGADGWFKVYGGRLMEQLVVAEKEWLVAHPDGALSQ